MTMQTAATAARPRKFTPAFAIVAVGVVALMSAIAAVRGDFTAQALERTGLAGLFLLSAAGSVTVLVPLPVLPAIVLLGATANPLAAAAVAGVGMTAGMVPSYAAGRSAGRLLTVQKGAPGSRLRRAAGMMHGWYSRHENLAPFLVAAVPAPVLFEFSGLVAGASSVRPWNYFIATLAGRTLFALVFALSGYYGLSWLR